MSQPDWDSINWSDICQAIMSSYADEYLDRIVEAVKARRSIVARTTLLQIRPGETIRFSDRIRPQYLRGMHAKVVKVNGASVTVNIDNDPAYGRYSGAKGVRCSAVLVEIIK